MATTRMAAKPPVGAPATEPLRVAEGDCVLGAVLVAASPRGLCAILLGDDREALRADLHRRMGHRCWQPAGAEGERWLQEVAAAVQDPQRAWHWPLDVRGTAFQQAVWQGLRAIAPGQTVSYAELAQRLGRPGAHRAVAQACGANPLAVVIPCHRVVRADGGLSGYRWGVARKAALLQREAALAAA